MKIITTGLLIFCSCIISFAQKLNNEKIDGYKGIWFELGQKYEFGDKYSGGLGTYTAKHVPLAVYSKTVDKTFFVYGGTSNGEKRHLLAMIGEYNHKTQKVSKPTVVYDKETVNDPHDNPSLLINDDGYLFVFVSGRGKTRPGIKLKSTKPYSIEKFDILGEEEFTYPQIHKTSQGMFHFFTKYSGTRELYYETSTDGITWTEDQKLAGITEDYPTKAGHYQTSNVYNNGEIIGTFFNRHIDGNPDSRTDLYYLETKDFGKTWQNINGSKSILPLTKKDIKERVINYRAKGKNVYMKDMAYDQEGRPVVLYITSNGHEPGPANTPYEWRLTKWNGSEWETTIVCESDHNYDMGSLYIENDIWRIIGPTEKGPQDWGAGGEIAEWISKDQGKNWSKLKIITKNSTLNNSYVRRPVNAQAPFNYMWASGDSHQFSKSELYFGDFDGNVWKLPYEMSKKQQKPVKVKF
ncbi:BNR repeat-containing family member [Spirosomataceae bacterium TFI 002]|nr:BNR repeat-containing family member [Spirosomataceae bacterium TFI 002]